MFNWLWLWWDGASGGAAVVHPERYRVYRSTAESTQTSCRYSTQGRIDAECIDTNFRYNNEKRTTQLSERGKAWQAV